MRCSASIEEEIMAQCHPRGTGRKARGGEGCRNTKSRRAE